MSEAERQQEENVVNVKQQLETDNSVNQLALTPKVEIKNDFLFTKAKDLTGQSASLGLFAFGMTGLIADLAEVGAYDTNASVYGMGFFFAGLTQFVAGLICWKKGSSFGAAAFCSSGAYWMAYVGMKILTELDWASSLKGDALAVFMLTWTIFDGFLFACTFKMSVAFVVVFGGAFFKLLLKTIGAFADKEKVKEAGSYFGIIESVAAIYTAGAFLVNEAFEMTILPTGHKGEKLCQKN